MTEHWHVDTSVTQSHPVNKACGQKYKHTHVLRSPLAMERGRPDVLTGSLQLATTTAHRQRNATETVNA